MNTIKQNNIPGGAYFFTQILKQNANINLLDCVSQLKKSIQTVKSRSIFKLQAYVILPDRIHTIWQLPEFDSDHSGRWRSINNLFTRYLLDTGAVLNRNARGECELWQDKYAVQVIKNKEELEQKIEYIHNSPVAAGYVMRDTNWRHSSVHHYKNSGQHNNKAAQPGKAMEAA